VRKYSLVLVWFLYEDTFNMYEIIVIGCRVKMPD
jgi:hypothetical protein